MSAPNIDKILADMTREERVELARHMVSPVRCGGLSYIDGKPMYRVGGRYVTPEEFRAMSKSQAQEEAEAKG